MKTISTTVDNDIFMGDDGRLSVATGLEAAGKTAKHYAATSRAEMIHAFDDGIPFFQTVFARDVSLAQFEAALRRRLLNSPGVVGIEALETFQDGDVLRYTATIVTDYGQASING